MFCGSLLCWKSSFYDNLNIYHKPPPIALRTVWRAGGRPSRVARARPVRPEARLAPWWDRVGRAWRSAGRTCRRRTAAPWVPSGRPYVGAAPAEKHRNHEYRVCVPMWVQHLQRNTETMSTECVSLCGCSTCRETQKPWVPSVCPYVGAAPAEKHRNHEYRVCVPMWVQHLQRNTETRSRECASLCGCSTCRETQKPWVRSVHPCVGATPAEKHRNHEYGVHIPVWVQHLQRNTETMSTECTSLCGCNTCRETQKPWVRSARPCVGATPAEKHRNHEYGVHIPVWVQHLQRNTETMSTECTSLCGCNTCRETQKPWVRSAHPCVGATPAEKHRNHEYGVHIPVWVQHLQRNTETMSTECTSLCGCNTCRETQKPWVRSAHPCVGATPAEKHRNHEYGVHVPVWVQHLQRNTETMSTECTSLCGCNTCRETQKPWVRSAHPCVGATPAEKHRNHEYGVHVPVWVQHLQRNTETMRTECTSLCGCNTCRETQKPWVRSVHPCVGATPAEKHRNHEYGVHIPVWVQHLQRNTETMSTECTSLCGCNTCRETQKPWVRSAHPCVGAAPAEKHGNHEYGVRVPVWVQHLQRNTETMSTECTSLCGCNTCRETQKPWVRSARPCVGATPAEKHRNHEYGVHIPVWVQHLQRNTETMSMECASLCGSSTCRETRMVSFTRE